VAFIGGDGASQTGLYRCFPPNPCTPIADTHTAIPGGSGNFAIFLPKPLSGVGISGTNVAFVGADAGFMHSGVYVAFPPGAIFPIADTTIQTPGQPAGTFFDFFLNVSISGSAVAFRGLYGTKLNDGIFAAFPPNPCAVCAVPINMIADVSTAVPGGVGKILARQLIAAKLNIFNSSNPAPAASAIADADGLLTGFTGKMSYGVKTTSAIGTNMFGDANTLGNYDDGSLTPGCTP
jgi:hypothetical protein